MNGSAAASASGAGIALIGRNEGGSVLRRELYMLCWNQLHAYFRSGTQISDAPPRTVMAALSRVVTMCIVDANNKKAYAGLPANHRHAARVPGAE